MTNFKKITLQNLNNLEQNIEEFIKYLEVQNYAQRTIQCYGNCIKKFLNAFKNYDLQHVNHDNIKNYIHHLLANEKISTSYQKQMLGAINKFFQVTYNKQLHLKELYPKRKMSSLPKFLSQTEVKLIIEATHNLKHQCLILLLYSSGLRLTRIIHQIS